MTNKELQEILKQYPDDSEVLYSDAFLIYTGSVCDVEYEEEWNAVLLFTTQKETEERRAHA